MDFALLDHEHLIASRAYKKYPCIIPLVQHYENSIQLSTKYRVNVFEVCESEDGTRILLSAYLKRKKFNYVEFIIDVNLNKLVWHGTATLHMSFSNHIFQYSYRNMFARITKNDVFDVVMYELNGTNYKKECNSKTDKDLIIKLLLKLCKLIKLVN